MGGMLLPSPPLFLQNGQSRVKPDSVGELLLRNLSKHSHAQLPALDLEVTAFEETVFSMHTTPGAQSHTNCPQRPRICWDGGVLLPG